MRLTIDNKIVEALEGQTVLQAARGAGIEIPTLCYLEGVSDIGSCRLCVVEIEGKALLATACNTKVSLFRFSWAIYNATHYCYFNV